MAKDFSCIRGELTAKGIDPARLDELETTYNNLQRAFPAEDQVRITDRFKSVIEGRRHRRVEQGVTQVEAMARIQEFVAGGETPRDQLRRLEFVLSRDPTGRATYAHNFENMRELFHARLTSRMADTIQQLSPTWFHQVQDRALVDDVGRALVDPKADVSAEAKNLARSARSMMDEVRDWMNSKGIKVGKLDGFLPAEHTPSLTRAAGKEKWMADIKARSDFSRVIEYESGLPFTTNAETMARLDEVLGKVYENIVSDGMDLFDAFNATNRLSFADKFELKRLFRWKSYDDWKAHQEAYGNGGNLMDTLATYMNVSARDMAIIHTLGPDPTRTIQNLKDTATARVRGGDSAQKTLHRIDAMWHLVSGRAGIPENNFIAAAEEVGSTLVRTAQLGLSGIASVNDLVLSGSARHFNGLSRIGALPDAFNATASFYNRTNSERMGKLLRAGLGSETMLAGLIGNHRAQGEFVGARWLHRINDTFFRINGATAITQGVRNADGAAAAIGLRSVVEDGLASAHPNMRRALEGYGVTQEALDAIKDPRYKADFPEGAGVNIPKIMEDLGDGAAAPLMAIINDIKYMSSPAPSVALRAWLRGGPDLAPGTLRGLLWRSFTMFWQFPMAAAQTHILRRIYSGQTIKQSGSQLAAVVAVGTLAGIGLVQGRQIVSGKEPYEWDDADLIASGFLMSGMGGVTGDYVANILQGRLHGSGLLGPLATPLIGTGQTINALARQAVGDDDANVAAPALRTLRSITPGQNLPLIGVAINRMLLDQLRLLVDPDAHKYFRRQERRLRDEGREAWWRPGQPLPEFAR
jgi:hypothetical protein